MAFPGDLRPRGRNPSHPPYSLMIDTALRSLANESGSSQEAISAYIVANFDGLPLGHDKLLPYYLKKLTEQGEFVVVAPGRYSRAGENNEPVPDFVPTEGNVGVLPKTQSERNHVDVRVAEATTQQKDEACTASVPKRSGRPPERNKLRTRRGIDGEGGRGGTESTPSPEPERDHADVRVSEATTQQNADVGAHSASKRRGGPPKRNKLTPIVGTDGEGNRGGTESTTSPEPKRDQVDVRVAEATAQQNAEAGSSWTSRRRRTRPKTNKLSARRWTDGGGSQNATGLTPPPEPEGDHNDVRDAEATTQQNADAAAHLAYKHRGRPPKRNELTAITVSDGEGGRGGAESTPSPELERDHVNVKVQEATAQQNVEAGSSWTSRRRRTRPKTNKLNARRGTDGGGSQNAAGSTPPPEPERDHSDSAH